MRSALWYFDFVSPFAWICLHRLKELASDLRIEYRPLLFAGILGHHGQKGPAEIDSKRRFTYRWVHWSAQQLGVPLRFPAGHPFNPLHQLRLAIAAGCTPEAVRRIFEAVWTTGADATEPAAFTALRFRKVYASIIPYKPFDHVGNLLRPFPLYRNNKESIVLAFDSVENWLSAHADPPLLFALLLCDSQSNTNHQIP